MHDLRNTALGKLGVLEYRYSKITVIVMLILTVFFAAQSLNLSFESNMMKEIPQEFDVIKTQVFCERKKKLTMSKVIRDGLRR